jgi:RNA polymerase sigma factor (sigma-70 family)
MTAGASSLRQKQLVALLQCGTFAGLSDGELLDQFMARRDEAGEAAFAALVHRHGPMVLRTCLDLVGNEPDAHDAFQATFLVLIRRAGTIRQRNSVQSWLFGVARRVAAQVRIDSARRRRIEHKAAQLRVVDREGGDDAELRQVVAEEMARLPEKYRAPVLLCDLEGLTYDAAAQRLGCPAGTVGIRLMRARNRLRYRLNRRGIGLSSLAIADWVGWEKAQGLVVFHTSIDTWGEVLFPG